MEINLIFFAGVVWTYLQCICFVQAGRFL